MSILSKILGVFRRTESTPEEPWIVATSEDSGKPMIIRFRSDPPKGVDIAEYPQLLAISWKYEPANEGGMPSKADRDRMIVLENLLEPLESKRTAFLTVSVTCNGVKEWQWYSRSQEETMRHLNSALSRQTPFPIEIAHQHDPGWSAYFGFRNGQSGEE